MDPAQLTKLLYKKMKLFEHFELQILEFYAGYAKCFIPFSEKTKNHLGTMNAALIPDLPELYGTQKCKDLLLPFAF